MAITTVESETTLTFSENLEGNALLENLRSQREEGKFCDIVLHVQNKLFPAHRSVLAASSPYFESVLKNHRVTKEEINIGWHDVKTFEILLDYMYSGCVVIDQQNVYELLKLANHFLITKLKGYCEEYLERFLSLDNCLNIKELADKYNMPSLQESSLNMIRDNINSILEKPQLSDLSPKKLEMFITDPGTGCDTVPLPLLLNAIASWVKKDIPKRSLEFQRLIDVINWKDGDPNDIFNHIDNETLYQESKLCCYLILRTLMSNDIDIAKYNDGFEELRQEFEESSNLNMVQEVPERSAEESEGKGELLLSGSPIVVEPVEVTPTNSTSAKRRGTKRKNNAIKDSSSDNEQTKKTKVKNETTTEETLSSKTRKRNVKQKYSSLEWITEEIPTRRKSESNGTPKRAEITSDPLPEISIEDEPDHDDDEDYENDNCADDPDIKYDVDFKTEYSVRGKKHSASLAQWREGVKCPHCIYVGHSATRLEQHLARVHEEDNTYKCRLCPFTCKWNREYYKHMKTHFEGPPYKCEDCDYTCDRIQFILSHRMRHTDERPFHCELCPFKSRTKGNLIVHMRIHTGEKPYKCQYCGRCFAMKNTLDQHLATHRDDRPFLCDICGFTTKYQSHLLSHKRIHTGNVFHCQQPACSYFSPRRSQLAAHMRSHLSIRSHICSTCGRGFIEKSHLIRHERIHLEEKPFKCEYCDYGSTRRDKLKEHVLKHHTGDGNTKTPYKPRKPRRQSTVNINVGDELHSQLVVTTASSPQEIQISQASHMTEQELATANLIYEYSTSGEVTIPTRVVIQPALGDYGDGTQTVVVEQAKDDGSSNDSNAPQHVVIQTTGATYDATEEQLEEAAKNGRLSGRVGGQGDLGGLSALMAFI